jgi:hypothetical protein
MANFYETLLVPTNADNKLLKQRYQQILDSEGKWPDYPYHPMDLDYFLPAYETLLSPVKRAAYDEENNIVPQKAVFKTCMEWTPEELDSGAASQGKTPGPYFAHIGIANLINCGQIDFINGFSIRRTHAKQLVLIRPNGEPVETKPPFRIPLPDCIVEIDSKRTVMVRLKRKKHEQPNWSYKWNARAKKWFERPVFSSESDQAEADAEPKPKAGPKPKAKRNLKSEPKSKAKPKSKSRPLSRPYDLPFVFQITEEDIRASMMCPVCSAPVMSYEFKCKECDTQLRLCLQCFRRYAHEWTFCPNCGHCR